MSHVLSRLAFSFFAFASARGDALARVLPETTIAHSDRLESVYCDPLIKGLLSVILDAN